MKSRFFSFQYVWNTLIIKYRALRLRMVRGAYPFDFYKKKTNTVAKIEYRLNHLLKYHSLDYLDNVRARKLHSGEISVTQQLILGLVYFNEWVKNQSLDTAYLMNLAEKLEAKAISSDREMIFYFTEPYARFDLSGQYYSGIVQGKAASFFIRCYQLTKEDKYKYWAKKCLLAGWIPTEDKGIRRTLNDDNFWVEEYPSPKPSMVLNGFLFYLIGLAEYLALVEDEELKKIFEECLHSAVTWMPNYRLRSGLLYSMYRWNLCNVHYTGIMKYQFEHLHQLTRIAIFKDYAKFTKGLTNWKTFKKIV